jgi:hypothetical protein
MSEGMNPPPLGLKRLEKLKELKRQLGLHLKFEEDDSGLWNEYVYAYAINFYTLFHEHYVSYPDFSECAVDAARHNAVVSTLDVIRKQLYNFRSLQPAYEKKVFERLSEHMKREEDKRRLPPLPIPSPSIRIPAIGIGTESPLLKMALAAKPLAPSDPVASRRQAFIQPLLEERGWSLYDWAKEAKVSHHTASDYFNNKRRTQPYNRKGLAEALSLTYQQFPK